MANATINLQVKDAATAKVQALAQQLAAAGKAAQGLGHPAVGAQLQGYARQVNAVAKNLGQTAQQANAVTTNVNRAQQAIRAFGTAAGGGQVMNLLGFNGPIAAVAAVGAALQQMVKLAVDFNRVTTAAVFMQTTNADKLLSNLADFQAKAKSLTDLGVGPMEAAQMMAAYGMASGRDMTGPGGVINQARSIAEWGRAYGAPDLAQFAQQAGQIEQTAGPNVDKTMSAIFGGASVAGDFGRRIPELMGTVDKVLNMMAATTIGRDQPDIRDAMREIAGITSHGGYYGTTMGAQAMLGAYNQLGQSVLGNPRAAGLARLAGWQPRDMVTGTNDPKKLDAMTGLLSKESWMAGVFDIMSFGVSPAQAGKLMDLIKMSPGGHVALDKIPGAMKGVRDEKFKGSDAGSIAQFVANLEEKQLDFGQGSVHNAIIATKFALDRVNDILPKIYNAIERLRFTVSTPEQREQYLTAHPEERDLYNDMSGMRLRGSSDPRMQMLLARLAKQMPGVNEDAIANQLSQMESGGNYMHAPNSSDAMGKYQFQGHQVNLKDGHTSTIAELAKKLDSAHYRALGSDAAYEQWLIGGTPEADHMQDLMFLQHQIDYGVKTPGDVGALWLGGPDGMNARRHNRPFGKDANGTSVYKWGKILESTPGVYTGAPTRAILERRAITARGDRDFFDPGLYSLPDQVPLPGEDPAHPGMVDPRKTVPTHKTTKTQHVVDGRTVYVETNVKVTLGPRVADRTTGSTHRSGAYA